MHSYRLAAGLAALALVLAAPPAAALKNVSYPEVKVTVSKAYKPDADFQKTPATAAEGTYYRSSEGGNASQIVFRHRGLLRFLWNELLLI